MTEYNLNKPAHLVAAQVIRAIEALGPVQFGPQSTQCVEQVVQQYQDKLLEESQRTAAAQLEARKLAGKIDDMQHDFGVIAFCGLNMSKDDKESFRSEDSIPALQTLEQVRDEVNQLKAETKARETRFVRHLDALSKFLRDLMTRSRARYGNGVNNIIVELMHEDGGDTQLATVMNPGTDWYHQTTDQILEKLAHAKISEGIAAYLLDVSRIEVRVMMEDKFGANWRDIAEIEDTK